MKPSRPGAPARAKIGGRGRGKKGTLKRIKTGANSGGGRQRNVGHRNAEEHNRPGNTGKRQQKRINKPQQPGGGKGK